MTTGASVSIVVIAVGFFWLDQWSKRALAGRSVSWGRVLRLRPVIHVERFYRRTSARVALVTLWCGSLTAAIVLYRFHAWFHNPVAALGLGLALAGAAGNLTDILSRRAIVNFIDLGWWPVFNLADVGIVAGLIAAFLARA